MSFGPVEGAKTLHFVVLEVTLVGRPIGVDSKSMPVPFVVLPVTFILGQDSVAIALTVVNLKSVSVSYFRKILSQLGSSQFLLICLLNNCVCSFFKVRHLAIIQ